MSIGGTAAHRVIEGLSPLVRRAVDCATNVGFEMSCLPEQGRLLAILAAGRSGGVFGETGTGCGVGLAWMVSAASPTTTFVSMELDSDRAQAAAQVFAEDANVTIRHGDWSELLQYGAFDLLVLDGGGNGKAGDACVEPSRWLTPTGMLVIDDFTPLASWPPRFRGAVDEVRLHWLEHPDLLSTEVRTSPNHAAILGLRR